MRHFTGSIVVFCCALVFQLSLHAQDNRRPDGDGTVKITGELKQWHNVILTLDGPFAHELDNDPNPFSERQMNVVFKHESGTPSYNVPGYFAADGNAAETSAESGTKWRAHLSPDKIGTWSYTIKFKGTKFDGKSGNFNVAATDQTGADLRAKGRLKNNGTRYLVYAGTGEVFLKAGADAPETFLAYKDFDNTVANKPGKCKLKTWEPHVRDWKEGDPTWKGGKGKGMIGAINYLAGHGTNAFSFITYNAGGDGDNVWPHASRDDKLHFDCSKLDQWGIVFNHGTAKGMFLHFKLQETENDDLKGPGKNQALDGGELGIQRKTYLREMIARFGHNLALNWNVGEENSQTFKQSSDMIRYIAETDPYDHHIVLHTYPDQHNKVYGSYLGKKDLLTGLSIQNNDVADSHEDTLEWIEKSAKAGHPWVVAIDEAGNAGAGTPPDEDFPGMKGAREQALKGGKKKKLKVPTVDDVRTEVLWGTLMAGGMGVEYYFGYRLPESDLHCENWRSRDDTWRYSGIALKFFKENKIPVQDMQNVDELVGNGPKENKRFCLADPGKIYLVYLRDAQTADLDLSGVDAAFNVSWFDPRNGGGLQTGSVETVSGGSKVSLGAPPKDSGKDWVVLLKK